MKFPDNWYSDERDWVKRKWELIRNAQQKADESNNAWAKVNGEINDLLDRRGEFDVVQRAKIKGESLALKDALATGNWHSRNAERHIADLQLFLKMKEMGLL